jgi:hypothetical protein
MKLRISRVLHGVTVHSCETKCCNVAYVGKRNALQHFTLQCEIVQMFENQAQSIGRMQETKYFRTSNIHLFIR